MAWSWRKDDDVAGGGTSGEPRKLTSKATAAQLGLTASQLNKLPANELPYTTSPGGPIRGGRRYYRPQDVAAYKALRDAGPHWAAELNRAVHEQGREIDDLRTRVERLEQQPPAE